MKKEIIKIGVIDIGNRNGIIISKFIKEINLLQKVFLLEKLESIQSDEIGQPPMNLKEAYFDIRDLFVVIKKHIAKHSYNHPIYSIITHHNFTDSRTVKHEPPGEEWGYFSVSDKKSLCIISNSDAMLKYNSSQKSSLQYLAFLFACELLIILGKKNISHGRPEKCLFDECVIREHFAASIESSIICEDCKKWLSSNKIPNDKLAAIYSILRYCKKKKIGKSFQDAMIHPGSAFIGGLSLGWLVDRINSNYWSYIILSYIFTIFTIFLKDRLNLRKDKNEQ